jgi:thiol:disulfide interchange protein DsbA
MTNTNNLSHLYFFGFVLALFSFGSLADTKFAPGQDWERVSPPVEVKTNAESVEIVELFWYGCPQCFAFEPELEKWVERQGSQIRFIRIPAVFNKNWAIHARTYYALEEMGLLADLHIPLFQAIHLQQRRLFTEKALADFVSEHGVQPSAFKEKYNSFSVDTKTRAAISMTRKYGITGVPAIIINGKYRSSPQKAGSYERLLKLADFLVAKESKL